VSHPAAIGRTRTVFNVFPQPGGGVTRRPPIIMALAIAAGSAAALAAPRPFTVEDLIALDRLAEPATSAAHDQVAFTVSALDRAANRRRTDLWVAGPATSPRRLTSDPAADSGAVWSRDGSTIWFLSSRAGSSQVWKLTVAAAGGGRDAAAGEPVQVTRLPLDVGAFRVSPDERSLAVALEVFPDCATLSCTVDRLAAAAKSPATGRVYDQLFFRHWDSWKDGRRSHVFTVAMDGPATPVDVMKGMDADSPSKPFGGPEEFTFTPDGRSIVFTARDVGRQEPWSTNLDLFVVPTDGSSAPRPVTRANAATDVAPVFSPDGRTLAYRAMARAGYESDRLRIVLQPWPEGPARVLTDAWDRSPNEIVWSGDGRSIYATAANVGQQSLFAIDVASGNVRTIVKDGHLVAPALVGGKAGGAERLAVLIDHLKSPAELYTVRADGSELAALTSFNADRLKDLQMGDAEQFSFKGWNDEIVYAWVVKPVGFDASRTYPVAFLIHGGPQGSFSNNFHYRWNPQTYAAAGYAAVMVDFHGSTGYGQAFTDAIRGDWGGKPLVDLQKGLDAALARYRWLDGSRACALGASYGGYMINWIAGQWPDRFKCLVNHDGNLDERFAYFATEELWFPEWEHGGTPWTNPAAFSKHNPIDHVDKWKTPMLVIHGARDYRVVESQGMATFTLLQRRGIPSRFLYFPDENHWVLRPANSVLWHQTVLGWLDKWLRQ
jgi:dipeptidyl aminopeptidase/acylaminoacyl peptidase